MRKCSECGKYMTRGYVIDNGMEYYCSDVCLHKHYSEEEYLKLYNDGDGDSYWTEWEEEIKKEYEFLKSSIKRQDYFGFEKLFKKYNFKDDIKFDDALDKTLTYCLYDGFFNPYLEKEYLDCAYAKNFETGLIYNIDDIYDVFVETLDDIKEYGGVY